MSSTAPWRHWRRQLRAAVAFEGPPTFEGFEEWIHHALWAADYSLAHQIADHLRRAFMRSPYSPRSFEHERFLERQCYANGMWSITLGISAMKRARATNAREKRERKQRGF